MINWTMDHHKAYAQEQERKARRIRRTDLPENETGNGKRQRRRR